MRIQKRMSKKSAVKASNTRARRSRRAIKASEDEIVEEEEIEEVGDIDVAPEASDLLFEADDVAQLVAEVTGEDVAVVVEDDAVTFEVGEDAFVVEAEGDEEILENTRRPLRGKASVRASRKINRKAPRRASRR